MTRNPVRTTATGPALRAEKGRSSRTPEADAWPLPVVMEIDRALGRHPKAKHDLDSAVHRARKDAKRLRALFRLLEPAEGSGRPYRHVERRVGAAARDLAEARDAAVALATMDKLIARDARLSAIPELGKLRAALERKKRKIDKRSPERRLNDFRARMAECRGELRHEAPRPAAPDHAGFLRTYERCRRRMDKALAKRSVKSMHRWRQHAKYHYYQLKFLAKRWGLEIDDRIARAHDLEQTLGDYHDVHVLAALVRAKLRKPPPALAEALEAMSREKEAEALALGAELFGEPASDLAQRLEDTGKAVS